MITVKTDYESKKRAIQTWFKDYSGVTEVIWGAYEVEKRTRPYGVINYISSGEPIGIPSHFHAEDINGDLKEVIVQPKYLHLQMEVISAPEATLAEPWCSEMLENALHLLASNEVKTALLEAGLSSIEWTEPTRRDEQLGERWEHRAISDVTFAYMAVANQDDAAGWINKVKIEVSDSNGVLIPSTQMP